MSDWTEWPVEGWPEIIRYRRDVLRQISDQMTAGFRANSWGGVEIGGVLLGTCEGGSFSITDHRRVDCEHAHGPSYELTDRDRDSMRRAAETARSEGLEPIGWYKSVSNRELVMTGGDDAVWAALFPAGLLLILKRSKEGVSSGATYCRADGRILRGYRALEAEPMAPQRSENSGAEKPPGPDAAAHPVTAPPEDAPAEAARLEPVLLEVAPPEAVPSEAAAAVAAPPEDAPAVSVPPEAAPPEQLIMPAAADLTIEPVHAIDAFAPTPDPEFFYPSTQHKEALARLEYGITSRKGFILLVGDSGMGKTMLLECLSDRLKTAGIEYGFLLNSKLNREELFELLVNDLDLKPSSATKTAVLLALNDYLLKRAALGQITALLIDDAQKLSDDVLEEIELLSNLETRKGKLLQVVMAARSEFELRLSQPELAGLRQRFTLRPRLGPLSSEETADYIHARLDRAGDFGAASTLPIDEIHRLSGGVPRLISAICGQLLERRALNESNPQAAMAEVADELGLIV